MHEKVPAGGLVQPKCLVVAHGVHETGRREIIGLDVGATETESFWRDFLRSLMSRGPGGVQVAIGDAHSGLRRRSLRCSARRDSAAPWTSCATCAAMCAAISTTRWARSSAPSSSPAIAMRLAGGCATPSSSSNAGCRRSPPLGQCSAGKA
jgi:mutator family transposase